MVKMLRVQDSTYALVMREVGRQQRDRGKFISVDEALRQMLLSKDKKDPKAWEKWYNLRFNGPKTNAVEEIDTTQ